MCVTNLSGLDGAIDPGQAVGTVVHASLRTRICDSCQFVETVADLVDGTNPVCDNCHCPKPVEIKPCSCCGASVDSSKCSFYNGCASCRPVGMSVSGSQSAQSVIENPCYHIVEDARGIEKTADIETPTEEYYDELSKDMAARHPKASTTVLEHAASL